MEQHVSALLICLSLSLSSNNYFPAAEKFMCVRLSHSWFLLQISRDITCFSQCLTIVMFMKFCTCMFQKGRSRWPRVLRRGPTVARILGMWVLIPPAALVSVSCECCVVSCRGLCVGLVAGLEESYRVWCV
jgi:hypothetical protein